MIFKLFVLLVDTENNFNNLTIKVLRYIKIIFNLFVINRKCIF